MLQSILKNRNALIAVIFVVFALLIGGIAYYRYTYSPKYALSRAREAVERHDVATFQKYVDLDRVIASFIEQWLQYEHGKKKEKTGWDYLGMALAKGLLSTVQPYVVNEIKESVIAYIKTGKENVLLKGEGDVREVGEILGKIKTAEGKFDGVDYVREEEKVARVGMKIHFDRYDAPLILELTMEKADGSWKVVELANLAEFLQNLDELERKKIAELNKPIIEEMKKHLVLVDWKKEGYKDFLIKQVVVTLRLKNDWKEEVDKCDLKVIIKNSRGKVLFRGTVESDVNLASGKVGDIVFKRTVGFFDSNGYYLFNTPQSELKIEIEPVYVKFTSGKELKLYEMWQKV